ncbi:MAG: LPS assembly lipoprotein LptE [Opitutaceae bacterium]
MLTRRTVLASLSLIALSLFNGCASYQLGAPTELPFESIYIRPAGNESFAPQAQALLSANIRQAFIRDGRVKVLSDEKEADIVLEVTITDYIRQSAARRRDDTVSAATYNTTLVAQLSLYDTNKGNFLFQNRQLEERNNLYIQNPYTAAATDPTGFVKAEYDGMPILTRGLARQIADEVLSPWPAKTDAAQPVATETETAAEVEEVVTETE